MKGLSTYPVVPSKTSNWPYNTTVFGDSCTTDTHRLGAPVPTSREQAVCASAIICCAGAVRGISDVVVVDIGGAGQCIQA
jgi:hypothetical protein